MYTYTRRRWIKKLSYSDWESIAQRHEDDENVLLAVLLSIAEAFPHLNEFQVFQESKWSQTGLYKGN